MRDALSRTFAHPATPGLTLLAAALMAIVAANTSLYDAYLAFLSFEVGGDLGPLHLKKALILWINDGLMAVFFLLVGLELKREFLHGALREPSARLMPAAAALGGMAIPALVYVLFNWGDPTALRGWAIPAATDIAFALCVLTLLGSRAPISLKILLTTIAVIDDLGAIVIIALFYTSKISFVALGIAAVTVGVLGAMNRAGVRKLGLYLLVGAVLWVAVLKSGLHATIAGVVLALCIPADALAGEEESPLLHLEHALVPWVNYGVLPIFGFANAGIVLAGMGIATLVTPVPLGIMLGLFIGKQIGVFAGIAAVVKLTGCSLPVGSNWIQLYGVAMLTGIGFTMSLFIGGLAFPDGTQDDLVRLGVMAGSLLAAVSGAAVIAFGATKNVASTSGDDGSMHEFLEFREDEDEA
ncbi:MAG: NhaA family Na+:H+ antiporter [Bradymonadia bacterium]|jgi:NhaA family Na+:H+ antiporter